MTDRRADRTTDRDAPAGHAADDGADTGPGRHFPAFPSWRTFGAGWLADRLYRRNDESPPASTDGPSG